MHNLGSQFTLSSRKMIMSSNLSWRISHVIWAMLHNTDFFGMHWMLLIPMWNRIKLNSTILFIYQSLPPEIDITHCFSIEIRTSRWNFKGVVFGQSILVIWQKQQKKVLDCIWQTSETPCFKALYLTMPMMIRAIPRYRDHVLPSYARG